VNIKTPGNQLAARGWRFMVVRVLTLAGGWCVVSEGDRAALAFGVPVVLAALSASVLLPSPSSPRWSVPGLVRYVFAFLVGSLQGGIDVARRALAPRLALAPAILRYGLRLRTEPARHLFMGTLNLMPGTLSVSLDGDDLEVHVLIDRGDAVVLQLRRLETHVARAVGERLEDPHA
jgi:multicomponent Na+:H+ antiporter subunit E